MFLKEVVFGEAQPKLLCIIMTPHIWYIHTKVSVTFLWSDFWFSTLLYKVKTMWYEEWLSNHFIPWKVISFYDKSLKTVTAGPLQLARSCFRTFSVWFSFKCSCSIIGSPESIDALVTGCTILDALRKTVRKSIQYRGGYACQSKNQFLNSNFYKKLLIITIK